MSDEIVPHRCHTEDEVYVVCLCSRGEDHDEALFDVPLPDDPPTMIYPGEEVFPE